MEYLKEIFDLALLATNTSEIAKFTEITNHGILCSETGKPIVGSSRYYASYLLNEELKEINLSEEAFMEPTEFDHLTLIYFRLTHSLKRDTKLPVVDLTRIHKINATGFKFEFTITALRPYFSNKQAILDYFKEIDDQDMFKKNIPALFKN